MFEGTSAYFTEFEMVFVLLTLFFWLSQIVYFIGCWFSSYLGCSANEGICLIQHIVSESVFIRECQVVANLLHIQWVIREYQMKLNLIIHDTFSFNFLNMYKYNKMQTIIMIHFLLNWAIVILFAHDECVCMTFVCNWSPQRSCMCT